MYPTASPGTTAQVRNDYYPPAQAPAVAKATPANVTAVPGAAAVVPFGVPTTVTVSDRSLALAQPAPGGSPAPGPRPDAGAVAPATVGREGPTRPVEVAVREEVEAPPEVAAALVPPELASPTFAKVELSALPAFLPLPGGLLPVDLAAWEQRVADFFRRLDSLGDDSPGDAPWERLTPWCGLLGAMAVALEVARRQLGRQPPPDLAEAGGRGLAWKWRTDPKGNSPLEQP
jgi:hypothetical protein